MKKRFSVIILICFIFILTGCSVKLKNITIINMGISMKIPDNMVIVYTSQRTFDYNGLTIPSLSIDGISKDQKTVMNIKSFPFPPSDYINQYRSAFKGDNILEIKYDYKKLKVPKNSIFHSIYESKAILKTDKGKKDSYVYLVSFKDKAGCLVIQFTGNKGQKYKDYIDSIKLTRVNNFQVKSTADEQTYDNIKKFYLGNGLILQVPNTYEIKNRVSPVTGTYYLNLYGDKNDAIYICITENMPLPLSKNRWSMPNATEIIKVLDANNDRGNFIVHNINNSHLYYLNSDIKELKLKNGKTVYVRLDYLDKNNNKEYFEQIFNGIVVH